MGFGKLFFSVAGLLTSHLLATAQDYTQYVAPLSGSQGLGRVFIGPTAPFGMVKPSPDCTSSPNTGGLAEPTGAAGWPTTRRLGCSRKALR